MMGIELGSLRKILRKRQALAMALVIGSLTAAAGQAPAVAATAGPVSAWSFVSAPGLTPPRVTVGVHHRGTAPGLIFLGIFKNFAQKTKTLVGQPGPLILDEQGNPVWSDPVPANQEATDVKVQRYLGKPVLTWWQGSIALPGQSTSLPPGSPQPGASFHIVDSHYKAIGTVTAKDGFTADLHEFLITPRGTAVIEAYKTVTMDLTKYNGSATGKIGDEAVQEIDIKTGRLMSQWDFLGNVDPGDSYTPVPPRGVWDPFHMNAVDVDASGNLLISARDMWTIYKVDHGTGAIVWRLGGKKSDFTFGSNARFAFQHDARFAPGGEVSLFDNGCCELGGSGPPPEKQSRGLVLKLDTAQHQAMVAHQYLHHPALQAATQGKFQLLPGGDAFIGWGQLPYFTEYTSGGKVLYDVRLPDPDESYRTVRQVWVGTPLTRPSMAVRRSGHRTNVYASWNGATQVASWQVLAGASPKRLAVVAKGARRTGFETRIHLKADSSYLQVQALDADKHVLGSSAVTRRASKPAPVSTPPAGSGGAGGYY